MAGAACNPGRETAREITPVFMGQHRETIKMEEGLFVYSAKLFEKWAHAILSFPPFLLDYFVTGTGSNLPNRERKTQSSVSNLAWHL